MVWCVQGYTAFWERCGSVVECLTLDQGAAVWNCVVSLRKTYNSSLVLVQSRKNRPYITERLLMGHKESNQTNTQHFTRRIEGSLLLISLIIINDTIVEL